MNKVQYVCIYTQNCALFTIHVCINDVATSDHYRILRESTRKKRTSKKTAILGHVNRLQVLNNESELEHRSSN